MRAVTFLVGAVFLLGGIALGVLDALDRTIGLSTLIATGALMGFGALLITPTNAKATLTALGDAASRFWRPPAPPSGGQP